MCTDGQKMSDKIMLNVKSYKFNIFCLIVKDMFRLNAAEMSKLRLDKFWNIG